MKDWDVPWTIEDDSKLLAGVYEYGNGSWEAIKMDPTYALADKILPDGDLKPQAKQLQSRVDYLLRLIARKLVAEKMLSEKSRKLNSSSSKASSKEKNGDSSKSAKSSESSSKKDKGEKKKDKDKKEKKRKKKDKKRSRLDATGPPLHFTENPPTIITPLDHKVFEYCKEKMRPVKKALKLIGKNNLSSETQRECVLTIGARISDCLIELTDGSKSKEWRNNFWTFVAQFTEFSGKQLYRMYKSAMQNGRSSPHHSSSHRYDNNSHSHKDKSKRISESVSPSPSKRARSGDFAYRDSHGYPPPPPPPLPSGMPLSSHPPPISTQSSSRQASGGPPLIGGGNSGWQPRGPPGYMHQRGLPFHPHPSMIPPPPYPPYGPYHHPPNMPHMNNFTRNRSGGTGSGNHQRRMNDRSHDRGPVRQ